MAFLRLSLIEWSTSTSFSLWGRDFWHFVGLARGRSTWLPRALHWFFWWLLCLYSLFNSIAKFLEKKVSCQVTLFLTPFWSSSKSSLLLQRARLIPTILKKPVTMPKVAWHWDLTGLWNLCHSSFAKLMFLCLLKKAPSTISLTWFSQNAAVGVIMDELPINHHLSGSMNRSISWTYPRCAIHCSLGDLVQRY